MKEFLYAAVVWAGIAGFAALFVKLGLMLGEQLEYLLWLTMH